MVIFHSYVSLPEGMFPNSWDDDPNLTLAPSFFRGVGIPPTSFVCYLRVSKIGFDNAHPAKLRGSQIYWR